MTFLGIKTLKINSQGSVLGFLSYSREMECFHFVEEIDNTHTSNVSVLVI